eukprot:171657_1
MEYFKDSDNLIFSRAGCSITTISGTLSALSSILIMSIILRTQSKLSSTYHLIMFFMSFWDTIGSIAVALTTIPMPSDVGMVYDFEFKSYGTASTCEAQAIISGIARFLIMASNCALNLFYISTIRYHVAEEKFKWRVLPLIFLVGCIMVGVIVSLSLKTEYLNPQPFQTFCASGVYPYNCDGKRSDSNSERAGKKRECIRGDDAVESTQQNIMNTFLLVVSGSFFLITFVSLLAIVLTVFQNELRMKRLQESSQIQIGKKRKDDTFSKDRDSDSKEPSPPPVYNLLSLDKFKETRAVLSQALMYIFAFLLTYMWDVILVMTNAGKIFKPRPLLDGLRLFFSPMQGFFNALIFIYTKTYTLRHAAQNNPSFYSSVKTVIFAPSSIPELLVSSIDMVERKSDEGPVGPVLESLGPSYDLGQNGVISPASIKSDFLSRETPSFAYSKVMSTGDVSSSPNGMVMSGSSLSTPGISKGSSPSVESDLSYEESKSSRKGEEENKSSIGLKTSEKEKEEKKASSGLDKSKSMHKKSPSGTKKRRSFYSVSSSLSGLFGDLYKLKPEAVDRPDSKDDDSL